MEAITKTQWDHTQTDVFSAPIDIGNSVTP